MRKIENNILIVYVVFVVLAEIIHISINAAPPIYMRLIYVGVHLVFCIFNIKLIPIFVSISMIMQNFSVVFGEFLPASISYNIALVSYCYFQLRRMRFNHQPIIADDPKEYYSVFMFAFYVLLNALVYFNISFFCSVLFSVMFLMCLSDLEDEYLKSLIKYIVVAMALSSLLSLFNLDKSMIDYATSQGSVQRLAWKDSNYTSFFIGVIILISLFISTNNLDKKLRMLFNVISVLLLICLCLLISRGSIISLILACVFYFRRIIFSSKIVGYSLLIGVLFLFLYDTGLLDGVLERFNSEDFKNGSGRTHIWSVGLNTFQSKGLITLFLGEGVGAANNMALIKGIYFSPHNNFLEFLYNFGLIGLVLFLLWWVLLYIGSSDEKKTLILFIMINSMTVCPFIYVQPIWIIISLIMIWDTRINKLIYE